MLLEEVLIWVPWVADRTTRLEDKGFDCELMTSGRAPLARTLLSPAPEKQESRTIVTLFAFSSPNF